MDTQRLRTETRPEHEATESLMPLMQVGLTRERYRDVLVAMHRVVHAWETWATANAPQTLAETVGNRRRDALLHADLLALGAADILEHQQTAAPTFAASFPDAAHDPAAFEAAFLGAMYVMEGSRLGGQYIAQHVEDKLGLAPGVGDAYFRGFGSNTGTMWQEFKQLLMAVPDQYTETVIAAAKAMFHYFGEGIRDGAF